MITPRIWEFPTLSVSKQLFHVPGAAFDGGFTGSGVSITSPEPGGRSVLEMQLSLQTQEWDYPLASWIMSKINGVIFRVRLAPTPQIARVRQAGGVPWDNNGPWSNGANWAGDTITYAVADALEGTAEVRCDVSQLNQGLRPGHVIGIGGTSYLIDEVEYSGNNATIVVMPPLRKNVLNGEVIYLRPWFTGTISNGSEIRALYESSMNGAIQLEKIVFDEAILP